MMGYNLLNVEWRVETSRVDCNYEKVGDSLYRLKI